jgi:hypothetical protein
MVRTVRRQALQLGIRGPQRPCQRVEVVSTPFDRVHIGHRLHSCILEAARNPGSPRLTARGPAICVLKKSLLRLPSTLLIRLYPTIPSASSIRLL